ncbi:MAG: hypothetical protein C5B47_02975 [Verrucomicrobia bacterium]|nr:MAG: hypothetical protein C5B47_02975 [Verrucomicrobiota bacterium]
MTLLKKSALKNQTRLFTVASSQGGYFTAKQAENAGFIRTNHAYHVRVGNWERQHPGIFRLAYYPFPSRSDLILWSLWSRDHNDVPRGIYSHQSALSIYDLSNLMPSKLHMTVPWKFRKGSKIPPVLRLHFSDLQPSEIEERDGYQVTRPMKTILDLIEAKEISNGQVSQALHEARTRGLVTEKEIQKNHIQLAPFLF